MIMPPSKQTTKVHRRLKLTSLALLPLTLSANVSAQMLEEVVVTATKRDQNLQDVPMAITAITGDELQKREIRDMRDLNTEAPNVFVGQNSASTAITIRGVSHSSTSGADEGSIAVHIDGVFQPRVGNLIGAFNDLESLEVLRGPQGTLYGRNATGGSINLTTSKPTDTFEGTLGALAGNYDRYRFRGIVSGPITETVLGRVSAFHDERDAYIENELPGFDDIDPDKTFGVRGALRVLATDALMVDASLSYEDQKGGSMLSTFTPPTTLLTPIFANALYSTDRDKQYSDLNADEKREDTRATVTINWDVSDTVSFKSITGYIKNEQEVNFDGDGTSVPAVHATPTTTDADTWSQEFTGNFVLADGRVDLLVGAYYFNEDLDFGFDLPLGTVAAIIQGTPDPVEPFPDLFFDTRRKTEAYALFADATVTLSDSWTLNLGARASYEEKKATVENFVLEPLCGFGTPAAQLDEDWDDISPRVGVQYAINDSSMAYLQWQEGFKSGGFNSNSCEDVFEPEEIASWEAGYKTEFFDGRALLNAAAFYYDYTDLQLQTVTPVGVEIDNAGESEIYGLEIEGGFLVSESFSIDYALTWLKTEYGDVIDCDPLVFPGNCQAPVVAAGAAVFESIEGNALSRAPEYTARIGLDYTLNPSPETEVSLRGDYFWSDDVNFRQFDRELDRQDSYYQIDLYADLTFLNSGVTLGAYVRNATDEEVLVTVVDLGSASFNRLARWAPPRTWGAEISYNF